MNLLKIFYCKALSHFAFSEKSKSSKYVFLKIREKKVKWKHMKMKVAVNQMAQTKDNI